MNAVKEGLATIIPISTLEVLTWEELEVVVCGSPYLDVDFLQAHTVLLFPLPTSRTSAVFRC
jgi:hypothetical protein